MIKKFDITPKVPRPVTPEQFAQEAAVSRAALDGVRPLKPVRLNLDLDVATHADLKAISQRTRVPVAAMVRYWIEKEIAADKAAGNPEFAGR